MTKTKEWTKDEDELIRFGREFAPPVTYAKLAKRLDRGQDATRNRAFVLGLARPSGEPWYAGLRMGFLDIETSNFDADAGSMLSWSIKMRGGPLLSDVVTRKEEISCKFDERIVASLLKALENVDIVCTYYGSGFDLPYLKSRALMLGMKPPGAGDLYHFDVYYLIRYRLKLHRNSLDAACAAFNIRGKSHLDLPIWNKARVGDEEALAYVLEHNRQDVKILEKLFNKVERLSKWTRKSV